MIRLILSILGLIVGILSILIGVAPTSVAGITGKALIVICAIYIVYFFVKKRQAQNGRQLRGRQGVSTKRRVFLALSILGLLFGLFLFLFFYFAGAFYTGIILTIVCGVYLVSRVGKESIGGLILSVLGLLAGLILIFFVHFLREFWAGVILLAVCGFYILSFFVKKAQPQKVREFPVHTPTVYRYTHETSFHAQRIWYFLTENRLTVVVQDLVLKIRRQIDIDK